MKMGLTKDTIVVGRIVINPNKSIDDMKTKLYKLGMTDDGVQQVMNMLLDVYMMGVEQGKRQNADNE